MPQGSILGSLLFLLYMNDLSNVSNIFGLILFADDMTPTYFILTKMHLVLINDEMSKLSEWFKANMLSINIKKSN